MRNSSSNAMIFGVNICLEGFQNSCPTGSPLNPRNLDQPQSAISHLMRPPTKCDGHRRPVRGLDLCLQGLLLTHLFTPQMQVAFFHIISSTTGLQGRLRSFISNSVGGGTILMHGLNLFAFFFRFNQPIAMPKDPNVLNLYVYNYARPFLDRAQGCVVCKYDLAAQKRFRVC